MEHSICMKYSGSHHCWRRASSAAVVASSPESLEAAEAALELSLMANRLRRTHTGTAPPQVLSAAGLLRRCRAGSSARGGGRPASGATPCPVEPAAEMLIARTTF